MPTTDVNIEDVARTLEHAQQRSGAMLEVLRAVQKTTPSGEDDNTVELKDALTNVIIMRTRLNERTASLIDLLDRLSKTESKDSIPIPVEVAERLGMK